MRGAACIVAAAALLVAGAATASANVGAAFQSPSGNIRCFTATDEFGLESFFCAVFTTAKPSCANGVRATWVDVRTRRAAALRCMSAATASELRSDSAGGRPPVLAYGRSKSVFSGRVTCTSRESGVTCRLRSGARLTMSRSRVASSAAPR